MKKIKVFLFIGIVGLFFSCELPYRFTVTTRLPYPADARPVRPGIEFVWITGDWYWNGRVYVWRDGYWTRPMKGYTWREGAWERKNRGWYWRPGYWKKNKPGR